MDYQKPDEKRPSRGGSNVRDEKALSRMTELAARYIAREAGRSTLITPLRSEVSSDRKHATVFVSIFPDQEREHALKFLNRHSDMFRDFLKKEGRFAVLPFVKFEYDYGEENRQNLDTLSKDIDLG
jgi:ribosome-binding factor A